MIERGGTAVTLRRNVLALMSGLLLWTAGHFGVLAVLPLFLHDQGYDARAIGFMLGATGVAQLCVRPFGGWILDAFGRRVPLVLALVLLSGAAALLLVPTGWAVLANRVLTGAAFSIGTTAFYTLSVEVAPPGRGSEVQGTWRWGSRSAWASALRYWSGSTRASCPRAPAHPNVWWQSPSARSPWRY